MKDLLGDNFVEGMKVVDVMDVSVPAGTVFPVDITFSVPGVTADSNVAVLHYNGSAWEVVPSSAGNGSVTGTFESLSPVAIVADTAEAGTGAASPKTGEPGYRCGSRRNRSSCGSSSVWAEEKSILVHSDARPPGV